MCSYTSSQARKECADTSQAAWRAWLHASAGLSPCARRSASSCSPSSLELRSCSPSTVLQSSVGCVLASPPSASFSCRCDLFSFRVFLSAHLNGIPCSSCSAATTSKVLPSAAICLRSLRVRSSQTKCEIKMPASKRQLWSKGQSVSGLSSPGIGS